MQWLHKLDLSSNGDYLSLLLNMLTHILETHIYMSFACIHTPAGDIRYEGAAALTKALKKMPNLELLNLSGK